MILPLPNKTAWDPRVIMNVRLFLNQNSYKAKTATCFFWTSGRPKIFDAGDRPTERRSRSSSSNKHQRIGRRWYRCLPMSINGTMMIRTNMSDSLV